VDRILDEFDKKAKEFLDKGRPDRLRNILREYAMCVAYETGEELENPSRFLRMTGIDFENIDNFTEYRVAKSVIRSEIRKKKGDSYFTKLRKKVSDR